jgi:hypothetical protein
MEIQPLVPIMGFIGCGESIAVWPMAERYVVLASLNMTEKEVASRERTASNMCMKDVYGKQLTIK